MAGLGLAKVGFDPYVKFVVPVMVILAAIILAVLLLSAAL